MFHIPYDRNLQSQFEHRVEVGFKNCSTANSCNEEDDRVTLLLAEQGDVVLKNSVSPIVKFERHQQGPLAINIFNPRYNSKT